jgi:hypothetical protein
MAAYIGFSGAKGDFIYVEEDAAVVVEKLKPTARVATGFGELTHVPTGPQDLEPTTIYINPNRVAYVRQAVGG